MERKLLSLFDGARRRCGQARA